MKHDEYSSFLRFDDPPAPQDPPLLHNPLSPPRSRASFNPSSPGGSSRHSARNSTPLPQQLYPRILTPKPKRSSEGDTSQPPENLRNWARHTISHSTLPPEEAQVHQEHLATTDSLRSVALSLCDTDAFSPQVLPKYPGPSPIGDASTPQLGAHEHEQASFQRGAENDMSINHENLLTETNNITMQEPRSSSPTPDAPPMYGSSDCISLGFLPLASSEDHSEDLGLTEQAEPDSGYSTHNRDDTEGDTDWRSMISSVLNVYYRDLDGASIVEDHWSPTDDIDAGVSLEDTVAGPSVAPHSENDLSSEPGSNSSSPPLPETSPRCRKPVSLFLNTTSIWEAEGGPSLRIMPQTAPAVGNSRPLPPLPNFSQRSIRPLPRPPVPPEYSPPPTSSSTPDIPSTVYSPAPLARTLSLHTPCPSSSSSATCASSSPYSNWSTNPSPAVPRTAPKRPLPPLLAVSPCISEPLSPDIPIPPSPGTARRLQASKVSKILGEVITLEPPGLLGSTPPLSRLPKRSQSSKPNKVLGDNIPVELPGLFIQNLPKPPSPKAANRSQVSKVSRILGEDIPVELPGLVSPGLPVPSSPKVARRPTGSSKISRRLGEEVLPELPSLQKPYIPVPPSPRTAKRFQASKASKILGEDVPPELVYRQGAPPPVQPESPPRGIPTVWDMEILRSRLRARQDRPQAVYLDNASEFDADISEDAESQVEVKTDHMADEEENDQSNMSVYSMNASLSSEDFGDDDLDDTEEGRISWALQTVVTYETASRVKRTSRMWVLEKNGERKEEGDYANVLKALRQL